MKNSVLSLVAFGFVATMCPEMTRGQDPLKPADPALVQTGNPIASDGSVPGTFELELVVGKAVDKDALMTVVRELGRLDIRSQVKVTVIAAKKPDALSAQIYIIDDAPYVEVKQIIEVLEKNKIGVHLGRGRSAPSVHMTKPLGASSFTDPATAQLNESIWTTAQALADAKKLLGARHPKILSLQTKLRSSVTAAFETRQRAQRNHLKRLKEQHARIEAHIANREKQKNHIIDHRIAEILRSSGDGIDYTLIDSAGDPPAVARLNKPQPTAPSADAVKLFELQERRWALGLEAFQSGNTTTEKLIDMANELYEAERGAAKSNAEVEAAFANHVQKLETIRKFAQTRYKNGDESQSSLLSAEVALLKARLSQ